MAKPRLLYASPFPPERSGIADYSAGLIHDLATHFDVTLYTADYTISDPAIRDRYRVLRHGVDRVAFDGFDYRLYHIGNNPWYHGYIYEAALSHPGVVVLHEAVLYYLFIGVYQDRPDFLAHLYRIGGPEAVSVVKEAFKAGKPALQATDVHRAPLNLELLRSKNRFLVHSDYTRRVIERAEPSLIVDRIDLAQPVPPDSTRGRDEVWSTTGQLIPPEATVVASFGIIAPSKLNHAVCRAVRRLNAEGHNFYYVMVGEGSYADEYLEDRIRKTGYIDASSYDEHLHACDLVLNLRYPVMGETSAALLRAMAACKPCVVCDLGWFSELPDNAVLKLDASRPALIEEHVYEALRLFNSHRGVFAEMGVEGFEYVKTRHAPGVVAGHIAAQLRGD